MNPRMKPYNAKGHTDEAGGVLNTNPWKESAELKIRKKPESTLARPCCAVSKAGSRHWKQVSGDNVVSWFSFKYYRF